MNFYTSGYFELQINMSIMMFQYGQAEIYYRVVNMRDLEVQSLTQISASNHNQYQAPVVSLLKIDSLILFYLCF